MPSSILSQGEIDALLQGTGSQPRSDALLDALRRAFFSALDQLITSFDEPEMNGPYVERLEHSLAQEVAPAAFVVAAELGGRDLLLLVSTPDAERLAEELGIAPLTMMEAMGQAWVSQLAEALDLGYTVYQGQQVELEALSLPPGSRPHLVRYFLRTGQERLELCVVITDFEGLEPLAEQAAQNPSAQKTNPLQPGRKLMKGPELAVGKAVFTPIGDLGHVENKQGLGLLEDIDLTITVELGRTTLTLNEILDLKPQSVIELDRIAGEPVDVYVNNNRVARGEVVVLDDNFGVRILEIVPKSQRTRE